MNCVRLYDLMAGCSQDRGGWHHPTRGNIHINKAHVPQDHLRIVILATLIRNRKAYGVLRWYGQTMMVSFLVQVKQIAVGTSWGVYLESNSNTACFITTFLFIISLYSDEDVFFFQIRTCIALHYTLWWQDAPEPETEVNNIVLYAIFTSTRPTYPLTIYE